MIFDSNKSRNCRVTQEGKCRSDDIFPPKVGRLSFCHHFPAFFLLSRKQWERQKTRQVQYYDSRVQASELVSYFRSICCNALLIIQQWKEGKQLVTYHCAQGRYCISRRCDKTVCYRLIAGLSNLNHWRVGCQKVECVHKQGTLTKKRTMMMSASLKHPATLNRCQWWMIFSYLTSVNI